MNDLALSGAVLALTMLEKSLNLNVVNLLTANNYKEYKITSADESLEINLKGNELINLSNFAEDIFDYIGDEHGIDTTFDRNDDERFCEVLTTLFNHYIKEHNDYIDEMYPEDTNNKMPHKIMFMEDYIKILTNLRANANEYDYEDDILTFATDFLVLMGYELDSLGGLEVKGLIDADSELLLDEAHRRESEENPFYHWIQKKKKIDSCEDKAEISKYKLDSQKLKELNLDRLKLLIYNRVFRNVHGTLSNVTGYNNILSIYITNPLSNVNERILFHDCKTAPIENEMYKIKLFNAITKQPYEDTAEQEKEVIKLFNKELKDFFDPIYTKAHLDYIKNLIILMSKTNIGHERQLLSAYIVTLLGAIIPQSPPVKNIRDCFILGKGDGRITIEELEDIVRCNYEAVKDPKVISNAIKNVKDGLKNLNNFQPRVIDLRNSEEGKDLGEFIKNILSALDNLDKNIGLNNKIDDLLEQTENQIDNNPINELLTDDERKVLEEYMPEDFDEDNTPQQN